MFELRWPVYDMYEILLHNCHDQVQTPLRDIRLHHRRRDGVGIHLIPMKHCFVNLTKSNQEIFTSETSPYHYHRDTVRNSFKLPLTNAMIVNNHTTPYSCENTYDVKKESN
jgi:hypothetical protein